MKRRSKALESSQTSLNESIKEALVAAELDESLEGSEAIEALSAHIKELGAQPGAETKGEENVDTSKDAQKEFMKTTASMKHNQLADEV